MKVRHKRASNYFGESNVVSERDIVYEVSEESEHYYIVMTKKGRNELSDMKLLSKRDYEPIPAEPTWRDVTAECKWSDWSNRLSHERSDGNEYWVEPPGYRLRKVQLCDLPHSLQWAFIVEKREP